MKRSNHSGARGGSLFFLADQYAKAMTQRRGGGAIHLSLETSLTGDSAPLESTLASHEESAEVAYDWQWAEVLVERAKMEVRAEYEKIGKAAWFDRLGGAQSSDTPYAQVAEELGCSLEAVKSFVPRMKRRFRAALELEVARTVAESSEVESEMAYLAQLLRQGG